MLCGRNSELEVLSTVLSAPSAGVSAALVIRGDPGVGKTALVAHVLRQVMAERQDVTLLETTAVPTDRPYVIHPIPDLATNVAALARVGIRAPSYYLLRPDGHIALAGTRLLEGEVQRYLSERFFS